jgi:hypothetical protein
MSDLRREVQRDLRQLRREARQPWRRWPRRIGAAIGAAARATGSFLKELVLEGIGEVLAGLVSLGLLGLVVALVAWGWRHSPAATSVLLVGTVGFLAYGGYELIARHRRRRGRLAATAAGAAGFVVLWASIVLTYYVG